MSPNLEAARWLISGRVQGVGFRWFVSRRANELGVFGWARNLADGRVEVIAEGTQDNLVSLERALKEGPRLATVRNVEKCDYPHEVVGFKSFDIR